MLERIFFGNISNYFENLLHNNYGGSKIATFCNFATCRNRPKSGRKRGSKIAAFAIKRNIRSPCFFNFEKRGQDAPQRFYSNFNRACACRYNSDKAHPVPLNYFSDDTQKDSSGLSLGTTSEDNTRHVVICPPTPILFFFHLSSSKGLWSVELHSYWRKLRRKAENAKNANKKRKKEKKKKHEFSWRKMDHLPRQVFDGT